MCTVLLILSPRRAGKRTRKKSHALSTLSRNRVARWSDSKLRAGITSWRSAGLWGAGYFPWLISAALHHGSEHLDRRAHCCGTRTAWRNLMNQAVQSSISHIAELGFLCRERVWLQSRHKNPPVLNKSPKTLMMNKTQRCHWGSVALGQVCKK